jgi:hypothetical protein
MIDDDFPGMSVNDGLETLGMIRPHGRAFEVYLARGDDLQYLAKADTRAEAVALLRDAHAAATAKPARSVRR